MNYVVIRTKLLWPTRSDYVIIEEPLRYKIWGVVVFDGDYDECLEFVNDLF